VSKSHAALLSSLMEFEEEVFASWDASDVDDAQVRLRQPLLSREAESRRLIVNLDPGLIQLIREVKYLAQMGKPVPQVGSKARAIGVVQVVPVAPGLRSMACRIVVCGHFSYRRHSPLMPVCVGRALSRMRL
jgi:hypothetical protein